MAEQEPGDKINQTYPAIYLHAASAATAPSAAAVVSCLTSLVRQSPAAKMPGCDVTQSSDARMNPFSSSLTTSAKISFCGIWPTAIKMPDTSSLYSFPCFLIIQDQTLNRLITDDIPHRRAEDEFYIFLFFQPSLRCSPHRGTHPAGGSDRLSCSNWTGTLRPGAPCFRRPRPPHLFRGRTCRRRSHSRIRRARSAAPHWARPDGGGSRRWQGSRFCSGILFLSSG